ncbi:MAG: stage II sporulation protein R [Firmicutes bacterium]|nr:stage II sporulation protein R [Bacillota bacterium]
MSKNFVWGLWIILMSASLISGFAGSFSESAQHINEYEGIIRFHVVANSNSEEDQQLKLQVRDYVITRLQEALGDSSDINGSRHYIEENLVNINDWAQGCIKDQGYSYKAATEIGVTAIPARTYDDIYFPAGNYEALTITIGEGKGRNWWCVIFPPLCIADVGGDYEAGLPAEKTYRPVLKSRLVEILRKTE